MRVRYLLAAVALLSLAACTPSAASTDAHRKPTPTPTVNPTPASGGLHVVHTPGVVVDDMHLKAGQCHARGTTATTVLPDPACTPGAIDPAVTQANIKTTICVKGYTSTIRPPLSATGPAKRASMADYGITNAATVEYDHLVPLELGGASATSNLWPELGATPNPKDNLESTLRAEVCSGKLTLAAAQQEIAANWTTAK